MPAGGGSCSASPTRRSGSRWNGRLLRLELVDLGEDLFVLGEAERHLVVVDLLAVDVDGEDPAGAFREVGGDAVLGLDGGLQTGGLGKIVSLAAVRDPDLHPILLSTSFPRMIRGASRPVKHAWRRICSSTPIPASTTRWRSCSRSPRPTCRSRPLPRWPAMSAWIAPPPISPASSRSPVPRSCRVLAGAPRLRSSVPSSRPGTCTAKTASATWTDSWSPTAGSGIQSRYCPVGCARAPI